MRSSWSEGKTCACHEARTRAAHRLTCSSELRSLTCGGAGETVECGPGAREIREAHSTAA